MPGLWRDRRKAGQAAGAGDWWVGGVFTALLDQTFFRLARLVLVAKHPANICVSDVAAPFISKSIFAPRSCVLGAHPNNRNSKSMLNAFTLTEP